MTRANIVAAFVILQGVYCGVQADSRSSIDGYRRYVVNQYSKCKSDAPDGLKESCCNRSVIQSLILNRPQSPPESEKKAIAYAKVSYNLCVDAHSTIAPGGDHTPPQDCVALAREAARQSGASQAIQDLAVNLTVEDAACKFNPSVCKCNLFSESGGCFPGSFYNTTSESDSDCPEGYFCPPATNCLIKCTEGTYCPGKVLTYSMDGSCPGPLGYCGVQESKCPGGEYCPMQKIKNTCPSGNFCKEAVEKPRQCNWFAICATGTEDPDLDFTGLVVVVVLAAFLLISLWTYQRRRWLSGLLMRCSCYRQNVKKVAVMSGDISDLVKMKLMKLKRTNSSNSLGLEDGYLSSRRNTGIDDDDELLLGAGLNEPKAYALDISYSNLSLKIRSGGATVLKGVSGRIRPGRITAVMGPSGAGKSSFLSAITGKATTYGTIGGDLYINGKPRQLRSFEKECGFVPQDDVMHRDLRVREVLQYQAELRLPKSWPHQKKMEKVAYVIKLLV